MTELIFILLLSSASSEVFTDRLPFELHKHSLICCLSASVFKAKGVWSQLMAPLVSKQDFVETLYRLCISDHPTWGQEHRMGEVELERSV